MRRVVFVVIATSTTACLFPSLGDLSGGDASSDASIDASDAGDASDASDAKDAKDGGGPAAIDDFEQGCDPWNGINANATASNVAHGGAKSCQICCSGTGSYCTFDRGSNAIVPVVVGKTYTATVWVRVAPQTASTNLGSGINEREIANGSYTAFSTYTSDPLTQAWAPYTASLQITNPGDGLNLYVAIDNYAAGDCFLVDDVSVTVSP